MPGNMIGTLEEKSGSILSVFFRFSLERADRNGSCRIWDCLDEILLSASFHIYFFISLYVRKCVSSIFVCNLISNVRSNYVSDVFFFIRKLLLQNDSYYLRRYANNSCPVFRHPTIYLIRKRIWRQTSLVIIERLIFLYINGTNIPLEINYIG